MEEWWSSPPLDPLFVIDLPPQQAPPLEEQENMISLAPFFLMTQAKAASILGMGMSTFSKRWRVASGGHRIWPYRQVQLLDAQIKSLSMCAGKEKEIAKLKREREDLLTPVSIPADSYAKKCE